MGLVVGASFPGGRRVRLPNGRKDRSLRWLGSGADDKPFDGHAEDARDSKEDLGAYVFASFERDVPRVSPVDPGQLIDPAKRQPG